MKDKLSTIVLVILLVIAVWYGYDSRENIALWFPTDFSDVQLIYENENLFTNETKVRYYYDNLSDNAKIAYTLVLPMIYEHVEYIEIPNISDKEFDDLMYALSYDNPDLICYGRESKIETHGRKYYFYPTYTHSKEECEKYRTELDNAVNKAIRSVNRYLSDYEKELYVHDYICNICQYEYIDEENFKAGAYDALVDGKAVCEGYARATQLLLLKLGVENYLVVGDGKDENGETVGHMWNVVKIDGKNYHLDVTWDDIENESESSINMCHMYFNLTDSKISINHFNIEPKSNNCVSEDYNYYKVEGMLFDTFSSDIEKALEAKLYDNYKKGNDSIEICFTNEEAFNNAYARLIDSSGFSDIANNVRRKHSEMKYSQAEYVYDDNLFVLQIAYS